MTTSEEVFEFIKHMASPRTVTYEDARIETVPGELTEEGLANALHALVKLVEIEATAALHRENLDAHMRQAHESTGGFGGPSGVVN
jgi:hypothetical protein